MTAPAVVKAPCARCPFRSDVPIYLRDDRRRQIVNALVDGLTFHCHEYVEWDEDDDGAAFIASQGPECAGAVKALDMAGGSTNLTRVAERIGLRSPADAQRGPDVWSLSVWPLVPEGETAATWDPDDDADDIETCNTVDAGCLAPAGYLGSGGAVVRGTEPADLECPGCGEAVCSNCADTEGLCGMCSEETDDDD